MAAEASELGPHTVNPQQGLSSYFEILEQTLAGWLADAGWG